MAHAPVEFVCPVCGGPFVLKGYKLRKWNWAKAQNPTRTGPYCGHVCASQFNIALAHQVQRAKVQPQASGASSTLVNAVDS